MAEPAILSGGKVFEWDSQVENLSRYQENQKICPENRLAYFCNYFRKIRATSPKIGLPPQYFSFGGGGEDASRISVGGKIQIWGGGGALHPPGLVRHWFKFLIAHNEP